MVTQKGHVQSPSLDIPVTFWLIEPQRRLGVSYACLYTMPMRLEVDFCVSQLSADNLVHARDSHCCKLTPHESTSVCLVCDVTAGYVLALHIATS